MKIMKRMSTFSGVGVEIEVPDEYENMPHNYMRDAIMPSEKPFEHPRLLTLGPYQQLTMAAPAAIYCEMVHTPDRYTDFMHEKQIEYYGSKTVNTRKSNFIKGLGWLSSIQTWSNKMWFNGRYETFLMKEDWPNWNHEAHDFMTSYEYNQKFGNTTDCEMYEAYPHIKKTQLNEMMKYYDDKTINRKLPIWMSALRINSAENRIVSFYKYADELVETKQPEIPDWQDVDSFMQMVNNYKQFEPSVYSNQYVKEQILKVVEENEMLLSQNQNVISSDMMKVSELEFELRNEKMLSNEIDFNNKFCEIFNTTDHPETKILNCNDDEQVGFSYYVGSNKIHDGKPIQMLLRRHYRQYEKSITVNSILEHVVGFVKINYNRQTDVIVFTPTVYPDYYIETAGLVVKNVMGRNVVIVSDLFMYEVLSEVYNPGYFNHFIFDITTNVVPMEYKLDTLLTVDLAKVDQLFENKAKLYYNTHLSSEKSVTIGFNSEFTGSVAASVVMNNKMKFYLYPIWSGLFKSSIIITQLESYDVDLPKNRNFFNDNRDIITASKVVEYEFDTQERFVTAQMLNMPKFKLVYEKYLQDGGVLTYDEFRLKHSLKNEVKSSQLVHYVKRELKNDDMFKNINEALSWIEGATAKMSTEKWKTVSAKAGVIVGQTHRKLIGCLTKFGFPKKHLVGSEIIELGGAPGLWTKYLIQHYGAITTNSCAAIDYRPEVLGLIRKSGSNIHLCKFQEINITRKYGFILSDLAMEHNYRNQIINHQQIVEDFIDILPNMLKRDGSIIFKIYVTTDVSMNNALLTLAKQFKRFDLIKPGGSKPLNSEVYFCGTGYLNCLEDEVVVKKRLLKSIHYHLLVKIMNLLYVLKDEKLQFTNKMIMIMLNRVSGLRNKQYRYKLNDDFYKRKNDILDTIEFLNKKDFESDPILSKMYLKELNILQDRIKEMEIYEDLAAYKFTDMVSAVLSNVKMDYKTVQSGQVICVKTNADSIEHLNFDKLNVSESYFYRDNNRNITLLAHIYVSDKNEYVVHLNESISKNLNYNQDVIIYDGYHKKDIEKFMFSQGLMIKAGIIEYRHFKNHFKNILPDKLYVFKRDNFYDFLCGLVNCKNSNGVSDHYDILGMVTNAIQLKLEANEMYVEQARNSSTMYKIRLTKNCEGQEITFENILSVFKESIKSYKSVNAIDQKTLLKLFDKFMITMKYNVITFDISMYRNKKVFSTIRINDYKRNNTINGLGYRNYVYDDLNILCLYKQVLKFIE